MAASPGHQKWPEHKVIEQRPDIHLQIYFNKKKIADSKDVIKVIEDKYPDRYYIPREDVEMDVLERTDHVTECPFKGTAHYYSLNADGRQSEDAVWTYENPFDEHLDLKNRLAFYDDKVDEFRTS